MTLTAHYTGNFVFAGLLGMPKTLTFETANVVRTTENRAGKIFNFQLAIHFIQNNLPNVFRNSISNRELPFLGLRNRGSGGLVVWWLVRSLNCKFSNLSFYI